MRAAPRIRLLGSLFLVVWVLLVARAFQVQVFQHARWAKAAEITRREVEVVPAARGVIRSSDGVILARSVINRSLGVDPKMVRDPGGLARVLGGLHLVDPVKFLGQLSEHHEGRFLWVNRDILPETTLDSLLVRFDGLVPMSEGKRLYPLGRAGGSVIGLVGRDEAALGGLETIFDQQLKGSPGKQMRISDASGTCFQGFCVQTLKAPEPGADLETTIDSRLQEIAAARLEAGVRREGAASGFCIVTRPATGEILAMVSVPTFDPEEPATWNAATLKVHPVADAFEPGSSYKLVTFSSVMEAGLFDPEEPINCMNGSRPCPGGSPIKDVHKFGVLKAWEVLAKSSNIGSGKLAEKAGKERFYRMEKAYGFGLPTGVPLPGEARGRIPEPSPSSPAWSQRSLITMAFGQEISCTGLQMAMAYGAVANGGDLMRPLLARRLRAPDGSVLQQWDPEVTRPVLRPSIAEQMRGLLRKVVESGGTGEKAEIENFPPAGKTSTAQKYIPEEGSYSSRRYIASFVGFAPYQDPQVLCLVLLDEPKASIYGGSVAAPIFREIVSDAIPILGGEGPIPADAKVRVVQQEADPRQEVPALAGLSPSLAARLVREAGFLVRLQGRGGSVTASQPAAGERCLPGSVVTVLLGSTQTRPVGPLVGPLAPLTRAARAGASHEDVAAAADSGGRFMPDLRGLSLRDALLRLRSVGEEPRITGSGWVVLQTPPPQTPISSSRGCQITLGPDSCRAYMEYVERERRTAWAAAAGDLFVGTPH